MNNRLRLRAATFGAAAGMGFIAVVATSAPVWAADADPLDPGFGNAGTVLTDFGGEDFAYGTVLQSDGKLVVAGYARATSYDFALARYNPDGSLDTTFGAGGKVVTDLGGTDTARAVALEPDGKIVLAGFSTLGVSTDFTVARYQVNGSLDTAFGGDGIARTDASGTDRYDGANAVAIQPDGGIVAAGPVDTADGVDFGAVRYLADGTVDPTFGHDGTVRADLGGADYPAGVAIGPDGDIAVVGSSNANGNSDFALARLRPDGDLDPGFGNSGIQLSDIRDAHRYDEARAVTTQADGKIVVAGSSEAAGSRDFTLARYRVDGSLDLTFGTDGTVLTDLAGAGRYDAALAVSLTADDGIVAAGAAGSVRNTDTAVARFHADGTLDAAFGSNGTAVVDLSGASGSDTAFGVAVRPDGRVVVAGQASENGGADFTVAQFLG